MGPSYWEFITRAPPAHEMQSGLNAVDNCLAKTAFWTFLFSTVYLASFWIPKYICPKWFAKLPPRKRAEWGSYAISSLHHIIMVPIGWTHIWADYHYSAAELAVVDYAVTEGWIAPISMGYLLGDTICYALPELLAGRWEYLVHHGFTLWFVVHTFLIPGHILRYIPHFLVCDTTNIVFNACWYIRLSPYAGSAFLKALELLFALQFFVLRIINLTIVIAMFWYHGFNHLLGWGGTLVLPVGGLQWFWMYKIICSALGVKSKAKMEKEGKEK